MKSLSKNMFMTIITRVVTLITGLIIQQKILVAYGSSLNGLTSSITQVMSYLVILEAGLGTASIQALYLPLASKNWDKVSEIIAATGKGYKKISIIFLICLISASILVPLAVANQIEFFVSGLLTLITGGSYVVAYILGGKYKVLLNADRKLYILNIADCVSIIISCILRVLALNYGMGIIFVQTINLCCTVAKNIGYVSYIKRKYKQINYHAKPDYKAVSKRWNVLIHSLAGLVVNNTDVLILTLFANLKIVSLYSVYNMVFAQLSTIIQSTFMQAPQSNFGQLYNGNKRKYEEYYAVYEVGFSIFLFVIISIALTMILPFVSIYTHGVSDINYIDNVLPILFALILLMNQIRIPALVTINSAGAFKETQKGAIIEALINIIVSLALFFLTPLGLYGLLIGTICSYIFRTSDVFIYVYKYLLERKSIKCIKLLLVNFGLLIFAYIVFNIAFPIVVNTFLDWIIKAIFVSIVISVIFVVGNYCCNRQETQNTIIFIIRIIKKKLIEKNKNVIK